MAFDVEAVRAEFPILQRQVNGHPLVYLDSAASAQKPQAVISAMSRAMETSYANVHRGLHTLANETTEAFEQARASVARFIGAETDEVVFTKGATEAINLVAAGVGARLQAGDEILLTQMEHHANIVPWHFLRERLGVVLRFAPVTDTGELDLAAMGEMIGPRTRVVAFSHMSNVLGTINPAAEIIAMAKAAGALTLVDGCQAVVHQMVDVKALDANFYVFSGHKLYGPTGIGVLYGKRERLEELPPYQGGGEMIATVTEDAITYADSPHRFEAGTPAIIEAIGLGAAIEWLNGLDRPAIAAHESALYARVLDQLSGANWLRVIGEAPGKGAILSFTMEGAHAHDVAQILDRYGVAVRAGAHCAEPLMRRFGVTSSARASFGLYNTEAEADAFAAALFKTQTFFG
ncbi:aminotransferase class V-fold PLP-dependent enzyme [Phenylobacterium sp.]|jgi:cysteine desulfurase/selenocysteine lyase|uniref:aminotransferase class V-fold PLP-dependent enzyme n=1 Tax=Phenylobacterium sp. TaxID=1871053 RepID=UPI000C8A6F45|nr:cysteine desulfurase [Phenylobacterium sp.]MAK80885.1 cysteine desulfurase [Phenylobacterium sp.]|tara:strand:+ start:83091 stop:84305 length:1215 start_codon:yes stop_codon:yes gene_type:complete